MGICKEQVNLAEALIWEIKAIQLMTTTVPGLKRQQASGELRKALTPDVQSHIHPAILTELGGVK